MPLSGILPWPLYFFPCGALWFGPIVGVSAVLQVRVAVPWG